MIWDDFNSRPCERGDPACPGISGSAKISIHAPARGATDGSSWIMSYQYCISIHAPARGATDEIANRLIQGG